MRVPPPGDAVPTERASGGPVEGHLLIPLGGCVLPLRPQSREARYYAAVHADTVQRGARAAMALADAELEAVAAHRDNLGAMIRRLGEFLDSRSLNSWKHGACWAAEDAIKALTTRVVVATARAEAAEARIAAAEALHQPASVFDDPWCLADGRAWPCPTTLALRGDPE